MPDARLVAHSMTEARLYLMVMPCPSCGTGPLRAAKAQTTREDVTGLIVAIDASCGSCEAATSIAFELPKEGGTEVDGRLDGRSDHTGTLQINTTQGPSRIIDVAHWLTLFRMGAEEAGRESDKTLARELWIEAGQYLAEALKFYDDPESDLPPPDAFFSDTSRARLRENPEQFSKQRLINMRARLPFPSAGSSHTSSARRFEEPQRRKSE